MKHKLGVVLKASMYQAQLQNVNVGKRREENVPKATLRCLGGKGECRNNISIL